ncbi:RraA family protein [Microvirga sp. 3-52]|uniref:RraA family protein n=1 Tax=Microvirga sp. 3-52 TaxID=2792425 RepID=UPI001AC6065A|nr:RraA family protein [Microvirga sp. 3-52]MBO1905842.1 RraA family protein [Microvirga sp. 3-52]MBS7453062.1 RraA family protein [Microvirga sp. 3-52]
MEQALSSEVFAALTAVDTPTVCNAIELVLGRRTAEGFTIRPVLAAHPNLPAIVGYARTALILSSLPSEDSPDAVRARRIAYYRYVAAHPGPAVVVLQDIDPRPGLGAFWGEVNVAIHKGLGARGVLTNGSMRDLGAVDPGFQILAGSLSPSHAFVRIEEFECPVEVFGLRVKPNDLVHADRHGAVIIDPELARELPRAIDLVTRKEAPILRAARSPGFTVEKLIEAWGEAEEMH